MFNNRRQIMVLYLNGNIKIWDLVIFKIVKISHISNKSNNNNNKNRKKNTVITKLLSSKELDNRIKEMEDLFEQYQTSDTLNNWCEVEIKSGKLLVTIKESSYLNVEVYYDELISLYPFWMLIIVIIFQDLLVKPNQMLAMTIDFILVLLC